jgi:short-subunit dehydrogenase
VHVLELDLGTADGPRRLHEAVVALDRPVAWLVNNAGFGMYGRFVDQDLGALQRMTRLNMDAVMELTHRFAPGMVRAGRGRIVQIASVGAFQPSPLYAVYSATKSFVRDFSQAVHHELRGTGVTVTSVCPGVTESEFHDVAAHEKPGWLRFVTMSSRSVAEISIRRAEAGAAHVTPGLMNLLMGWAVKLTPRSIATATAGFAMR